MPANPAASPITDVRTATPLVGLDSFIATDCSSAFTSPPFTLVAILSGTRYSAAPEAYTLSGLSVESTVTVVFSELIMTLLKPGDTIILVTWAFAS